MTLGSVVLWVAAGLALFVVLPALLGVVMIHERQVGIVVKKFARRALPPGKLVALLAAAARVKEASGEAEAIRATGGARADAYRAGVVALGVQGYTALQLMQVVGERGVRVVPDVSVRGEGGLLEALLGRLMRGESPSPQVS